MPLTTLWQMIDETCAGPNFQTVLQRSIMWAARRV